MTTTIQEGKYATAGSRWAGVGPYYAMFPTEFARQAIRTHTKRWQVVLDPFAGRATSLFAAASEDRIGLGVEINPVGWVYGKAKLQTADQEAVEERLKWIGKKAYLYRQKAELLPKFFNRCFCREVREFLLAARHLLDWRYRKTDWTTMALLLIDLHGKRENALSNQMRQTKAMSPQYAVNWWREHGLGPPKLDPVKFMLKKVSWRYAKGILTSGSGYIYLGDSRVKLKALESNNKKARLLLTSPPYYGVTNYFYDQWLRLWLLGGPDRPRSSGQECKGKFENKLDYVNMLCAIFSKSATLMTRGGVVYVRTDARQFTREATIEALEKAFPQKKLQSSNFSQPAFTQTSLFDSKVIAEGEIDFVMW